LKGAEYLSQADAMLARAADAIGHAAHVDAGTLNPDRLSQHSKGDALNGGNPWEGSSASVRIMNAVSLSRALMADARTKYKAAGKVSTTLANLARRTEALAAKHETQARADMEADALHAVHMWAHSVAIQLGEFRLREKRPTQAEKYYGAHMRRYYAAQSWQWQKLERAFNALPQDKRPADVVALMARIERINAGRALARVIDETRDALVEAIRANERAMGAQDLTRAIGNAAHAGVNSKWLVAQAQAVLADVAGHNKAWDALAAVRNAEKIEAWRAGQNVQLPREVPTMARIVGDDVQTSMGARVPLEHACRLARLARIAIRRGGQSWAPGDGPRVGHFQVQRIGADGSATIGCHEFNADEGTRALAMLDACPTCAQVNASEEVTA
jgi:hypothetical protein